MRKVHFRIRRPRSRPGVWPRLLLLFFLTLVGLTGYAAFASMRDAVVKTAASPPGIVLRPPSPTQTPIAERYLNVKLPLQPGEEPQFQAWDGQSQVTILLLGMDSRDGIDADPPQADTIILASLDPRSRRVVMLYIPPDLWVDIPGFGINPLREAYRLGEEPRQPGGGAALTLAAVEGLFGVPIPFYALVDFAAFAHLVDEIEGVKITVPEPILIDPVGDHNTRLLQPGVQTLPGDLALAYARAPGGEDSQLDRSDRQIQIILGIQRRISEFDLLPSLVSRAPVLYEEIAGGMRTNLTLEQTIQLIWLAMQIPPENLQQLTIEPDQVIRTTTADGETALQPIPEEILRLRAQFTASQPPPIPESILNMSAAQRVAAEAAVIELRNGTLTPGLATYTDEYLRQNGLTAAVISNAEQVYANTTLIVYAGKPHTIEFLAQLLNVPQSRVFQRFDPASEVDILIILGEDWAASHPGR